MEPTGNDERAFVRTTLDELAAAVRGQDDAGVTRALTLLVLEAPDAAAALALQLARPQIGGGWC